MDFERVDMDDMTEEELQEAFRMNQLLFKLNHTMPMTPEYENVLKELFGDNIGEITFRINYQIANVLECVFKFLFHIHTSYLIICIFAL
mgnify:CR=1 FL=1